MTDQVTLQIPRATLQHVLHAAADGASTGGLLYYPSQSEPPVHLERQSFAELREEAARILGGLQEAGCRSGEAVFLELDSARDLLPALWACLLGGLVAAPRPVTASEAAGDSRRAVAALPPPFGQGRPSVVVRAAADTCELDAGQRVVSLESLRGAPAATLASSDGRDVPALLLATSGSTGEPRRVVLTHGNVLASLAGSIHLNGYGAGEVSLNWLPLHHVGALLRSLREVMLEAVQVQVPSAAVASEPLRWLDLLSRHRATLGWAPNFAFALLLDALRRSPGGGDAWDLSALRSLHSSGEAVSGRTMLELARELEPHGLARTALHTAWGMTEVCFATCSHRLLAELHDDPGGLPSVGEPIAGVTLRIVDDEDRQLPDGETGHLQVRGPAVGRYLDGDAEASRAEGGWLRTGDYGFLRGGALTLTGRASERIFVRGRKVGIAEIESSVEAVPGVAPGTAIVAEVTSPGGDPVVLVVVVPASAEVELAPLAVACRERIARRHGLTARWVVPVAPGELPRSPVGKLRRRELVSRWLAGGIATATGYPFDLAGRASPEASRAADEGVVGLVDAIAAHLGAALGRETLGHDESFFGAGGDSLRVLQAVASLRDRFPASGLTAADLYRAPTATALAARIRGCLATTPAASLREMEASRRRRRARRLGAHGRADKPPGSWGGDPS